MQEVPAVTLDTDGGREECPECGELVDGIVTHGPSDHRLDPCGHRATLDLRRAAAGIPLADGSGDALEIDLDDLNPEYTDRICHRPKDAPGRDGVLESVVDALESADFALEGVTHADDPELWRSLHRAASQLDRARSRLVGELSEGGDPDA